MHKVSFLLSIFAAMAATAPQTSPAHAQVPQTWIASSGDDSHNCSRASPCATFGGAASKTNAGGEVKCLDQGGFLGGIGITKSVTIDCEGMYPTFMNANGAIQSIAISLTNAADVVTLRGLDIGGLGTYSSPILTFNGSGTLRLDKMRISSNATGCIYFVPAGPAKLHIIDSVIETCIGGALTAGITIKPANGVTATVAIERSVIDNNTFGIFADATGGGIIKGVVKDSFVTGNINNGITISSSGALAVLTIDNTLVANNAYGLVVGGGAAAMLVRRTSVVNNGTGLLASGGGNLYSYRDNNVNFNTGGGDGAFTQFLGLQ